ncbi:MAG: hypothetical protein SXV54_13945 [Chloroflexota bacterium]|nr:hypothetical protein [Chloroflexota bacterium]
MITLEVRGEREALEALDIDVPRLLQHNINKMGVAGKRMAVSITPVVTGAMQRAWTWYEGRLFINPSAVNPRSGTPVIEYAGDICARDDILGVVLGAMERTGVDFDYK